MHLPDVKQAAYASAHPHMPRANHHVLPGRDDTSNLLLRVMHVGVQFPERHFLGATLIEVSSLKWLVSAAAKYLVRCISLKHMFNAGNCGWA